ncbi:bifunctional riboflavin kinase/FAD synthetase [Terribacillus sp. 7520-G]|uniref:bifunctional riboflavin kinase/FAD synthetase n=1 Tax=Terribacillus sp. 7520-G TaxID=2025389 RepID=UPI000BA6F16B|nr:bifunctional riboflavin kinase/FAD synthetase [Terribacillus sp. 7520-G]PAD40105.1 riboflavin biosynthesis protein RibF [Terribacillus sp. 7520-G]
METIKLHYSETMKLDDMPAVSAAIGFFDGIHRGHQEVIKRAIDAAGERQLKSAVITFHPHPSVVLGKADTREDYLTPLREKEAILESMGIDYLYLIGFTKELAGLSPDDFIERFINGLAVRHLVSGFDFTYGKKGAGNADTLREAAKQHAFSYEAVAKVESGEEKISSTKIRQLVANGEVEAAIDLLGHPLTLTGEVITGDQRGRTIGYPTANIRIAEDYFLPKVGVYAVEVLIDDKTYKGMANLGFKPTFQEDAVVPNLEVHILDFDEQIYGEDVTVSWCKFIREEVKFDGIEALVAQLDRDKEQIGAYFA